MVFMGDPGKNHIYNNVWISATPIKARLYQYTIISRKRREVKEKMKMSRGFSAIYKIDGIMLQ